jgi:BolA family transcriptional regulator, general stress-responsive regulator
LSKYFESSFIAGDYDRLATQEQGMMLGPMGEALSRKLKQVFTPQSLDVIDESLLHAGHAGAHPQGESHFRIDIVAEVFAGKSRIERHRMVNEALAAELRSRVHALAIRAKAPEDGLSLAPLAANDERLVSLLRHNSLPVDDLGGEAKTFFGLVTATGEVVAVAGIELCGSDAMMRSVAVADAYRSKGLGRAIVRNLLADLRRKGVNAVYILTQSAEKFFAELGFSKVERGMVPKAVTETSQFTGTRCSSASAMMLKL